MLGKRREKYILLSFPISIGYPLGPGLVNFLRHQEKQRRNTLSVLGSISCKSPHSISGYPPRTESQDPSSEQERWDVGFPFWDDMCPAKNSVPMETHRQNPDSEIMSWRFYTLFSLPNLHLFDNTFLLMEDQLSHKSYHFICTGETAFDSWDLRMDADLIFFLGFFWAGAGLRIPFLFDGRRV